MFMYVGTGLEKLTIPNMDTPTNTIDQKYAPLSAADCFREALLVTVGASKLFRVYSNPGRSPVLFVFHHGAGYSALSAACLARELREQGDGQYGFLSYDCRAHGTLLFTFSLSHFHFVISTDVSTWLCLLLPGASQVESDDNAPPDLSLSTLANDLVDLLRTIYPDKTLAPAFVLVGHSMGGAVVTEACAGIQTHVGKVLGLVILDVVEGPISKKNSSLSTAQQTIQTCLLSLFLSPSEVRLGPQRLDQHDAAH
jgi:protein phosphatase methylesterase 1